jgi:hypothetical protein
MLGGVPLFQILLFLHSHIAQVLVFHDTNRVGSNLRFKFLVLGGDGFAMLAIRDLGIVHTKVEFIRIAKRSLLAGGLNAIFLAMIVNGSFLVILFLFQQTQMRPMLWLTTFFVRHALDGIAQRRHVARLDLPQILSSVGAATQLPPLLQSKRA